MKRLGKLAIWQKAIVVSAVMAFSGVCLESAVAFEIDVNMKFSSVALRVGENIVILDGPENRYWAASFFKGGFGIMDEYGNIFRDETSTYS